MEAELKLSIVIIGYNSGDVLPGCLRSIEMQAVSLPVETILGDNGSTDGSADRAEDEFPWVRVVRNGSNLGFAAGNNAAARHARGKYLLFLNADTVIHQGALEALIRFADDRPAAGAFGCRVLNPDGTDQRPAVPQPTPAGLWMAALRLNWPGRLSPALLGARYPGWHSDSEREIGSQSGCCLLIRRSVFEELGGFDARFFFWYEETDLCRRVWSSGRSVIFCPFATITHLGGHASRHMRLAVALETHRSRYRFFHKHYGPASLRSVRRAVLTHLAIRRWGYAALNIARRNQDIAERVLCHEAEWEWNRRVDPIRFIGAGEEPDLGHGPMGGDFSQPATTP